MSALNCLKKDLAALERDPPPGCSAAPKDGDMFLWEATIIGPQYTPYEGGVFSLTLKFPHNYPFKPPKVIFDTAIYHCNVGTDGRLCLDILNENWRPILTIEKVLLSVVLILASPDAEDPIRPAIARQHEYDHELHDRTAKEWTAKYAI